MNTPLPESFTDPEHNIGIRRLRQEDVAPYHEAALSSVPEAFQFMPWCHPDYSINEAQEFISSQIRLWDEHRSFGFSIYDLTTDALIGATEIAYPNFQEGYADLGYWMRSSQVGKGYTTVAAKLAVGFAFEVLGLTDLRIYCLPENMSSRRVAVKLGAKFHSKIPDFICIEGQMRASIYYQLSSKRLR